MDRYWNGRVEAKILYIPNRTRKAQLTQRETRDSGACLKAGCEPSNDVSFTLTRGCQIAQPVSLGRIGLKSQIFPTLLSFSALAQGDPFQIYGNALWILKLESSRQPTVKI